MRTVNNLLEAALKIKISAQVQLSFYDSSDDYIRLQQSQLSEGLLKNGEQIFNVKTRSFEYSPQYAKYKGKSEPIDLHDTGAFYNEIYIERKTDNSFKIDSRDDKSPMLQKRYGKDIFGLGDQRKLTFAAIAGDRLITNITEELNKT